MPWVDIEIILRKKGRRSSSCLRSQFLTKYTSFQERRGVAVTRRKLTRKACRKIASVRLTIWRAKIKKIKIIKLHHKEWSGATLWLPLSLKGSTARARKEWSRSDSKKKPSMMLSMKWTSVTIKANPARKKMRRRLRQIPERNCFTYLPTQAIKDIQRNQVRRLLSAFVANRGRRVKDRTKLKFIDYYFERQVS